MKKGKVTQKGRGCVEVHTSYIKTIGEFFTSPFV